MSQQCRCPDDLQAINQITGLMFRFIREDADKTAEEVAAYLEVDAQDVLDHESGEKPLSTARLYHAGRLFEVKISAFFRPYYYPEDFEVVEKSA